MQTSDRGGLRREGRCKVCAGRARFAYSIANAHGEPRQLDILLCTACGLLFVGTPLSDEQLAYAYGTLDQTGYYREVAETTEEKMARALATLGPLLAAGREPVSVLDVGCGDGRLLEALRRAFPSARLAGHELPGETAEATRAKGFQVFTERLEEIRETFSLVVLLDVLEHLPEPAAVLGGCRALLASGGHLYLHTPRRCVWDSLLLPLVNVPGASWLAHAWLQGRVSIFHLQLWTEKALRHCLAQAGFEVVSLRAAMELSWPPERYARVYLGEKLDLPAALVRAAAASMKLFFVRLKMLRNKAICLAQPAPRGPA